MADVNSSLGSISGGVILGRLANLHGPRLPQVPNGCLPSGLSVLKMLKPW